MRSSGHSPTPAATAATTDPVRRFLPFTATVPVGRPPGAVDGLEHLGAAGADQTGQADDLAGPHVEGDVAELARATKALDREDLGRVGRHWPSLREHVLEGASGHQPDHLGRRGLLRRQAGGGGASVLQHRHPVTDAPDLLEPVRDVDDGDALVGELGDDAEEVVDLFGVEHRRRLVHHDQLGLVGQRPGHRDDLLPAADRSPTSRLGEISGWPSRASRAREAARADRRWLMPPVQSSCPRKMFSATVESSTRSSSW